MRNKLPGSPYTLEDCEDIVPGVSGRMIAMVEEEARHRRQIERRRRVLDSKLELAGQAFGLFMAGFIIASGLLAFAEFLPRWFQGDVLRFYVF